MSLDFMDFKKINKQMNSSRLKAKFSQLSHCGLGYIIIKVNAECLSLINTKLLSIFKLMGQDTQTAANIFGGFSKRHKIRSSKKALITDNSRKAIVLEQSTNLKLMEEVIDSSLTTAITDTTHRKKSVEQVVHFLDVFSRFLKTQDFFKDMVSNNKEFDSEIIIFFSIMLTMLKNTDQAEHADFCPEGLLFSSYHALFLLENVNYSFICANSSDLPDLSKENQKHFPCACLLALEKTGTKLHIFPNSHKKVYDKYRTKDKRVIEKIREVCDMIEIRLSRGELLIFNALLIHYGPEYPELSKFARLHTYVLHPRFKEAFMDAKGNTQTHPFDLKKQDGYYYREINIEKGM